VPDVERAGGFLLDAIVLDLRARGDFDLRHCIGEAFASRAADEVLDHGAAAIGCSSHDYARAAHQLGGGIAPLMDDVNRLIGRSARGQIEHHAVFGEREIQVLQCPRLRTRRLRDERSHRGRVVLGPLLQSQQRHAGELRADERQCGHPVSVDEHDANACVRDPVLFEGVERYCSARCGREGARFQAAQVRVLPVFLALRRKTRSDEALERRAPQFHEGIARGPSRIELSAIAFAGWARFLQGHDAHAAADSCLTQS
jgi:hypothetical protein